MRNLANMRTTPGGATQPASLGDDVGDWLGELGVIRLQPDNALYTPELGATGVSFSAASGARRLRSVSGISRAATLPCTIFTVLDLTSNGYTDYIGASLRTTTNIQHGTYDANSSVQLDTSCREQVASLNIPSGSLTSGRHCFAYVWDGTSCNILSDANTTNRVSIGSGTTTSAMLELTNTGAQNGTVVAWGVVYGAISSEVWSNIRAVASTL